MKHSLKLLLLHFLFVTVAAAQTSKQTIISTDIDNFWSAFDQVKTTKDSLQQLAILQKEYVDKGTPGLKAFMQAKGYTTAAWLDCIRNYPKYWASIRQKTYQVKALNKEFDPYLKKFKQLYPELKPANIYFCIGAMRSGGTTLGDKVLIGAELATGDPEVDLSELPEGTKKWLNTYFGSQPFKNIVLLNMHEYVHTQEKRSGNNLLGQSIFEGTADFVAELITGKVPGMPYMTYGRTNEAELKQKFKEQMFLTNFSDWLYNGTANSFGVGDLGYYMGYAICKTYYNQAKDKKAAIKTLIELDYGDDAVVENFLGQTNYFKEGFDKATIIKAYESKKPVITSIGPFANGDVNVDPTLKQVQFHFSKPMKNKYSISLGVWGEESYPLTKVVGFSEDKKTITLEMELKPGRSYSFLVTGRGFQSEDGYPLVELPVTFKTK